MPKQDVPVVSLLLERQSHHPLLEGFPTATRIGELPLYLGEAGAAQDAEFLETNKIQAVVALGTGNLTVKPCEMLLIDILDMEEELLLPHFDECINFIKRHLKNEDAPVAVLVHCVYGQSRSAAICVASLMAIQGKTLLEAYDEDGNNPDIMGSTPAHAELRTMMAKRQRMKTGVADIVTSPVLVRPGSSICCRKCNYVLCTTRNQLTHNPANGGNCVGIYVEPMHWMTKNSGFVTSNDGKLLCPSCNAKLGSWNWIGVKCNCKCFISPLFQLVPSRTHSRVL